MATNKHAIIRYQTLDKCFRNPGRTYYIDDLIENDFSQQCTSTTQLSINFVLSNKNNIKTTKHYA